MSREIQLEHAPPTPRPWAEKIGPPTAGATRYANDWNDLGDIRVNVTGDIPGPILGVASIGGRIGVGKRSAPGQVQTLLLDTQRVRLTTA
jgi:hypothetical protein